MDTNLCRLSRSSRPNPPPKSIFNSNSYSAAAKPHVILRSMDKVEAILREALMRSGEILKKYAGKMGREDIHFKDEINIVTKADIESEEAIVGIIKAEFPSHAILAEESGKHNGEAEAAECAWVIDPLDGTTNFSHGFPIYCVSIAYMEGGAPLFGGVFDPTRDELFFSRKGGGASLNGKPIRVSAESELSRSLLATGFPYDIKVSKDNNLDFFSAFATRAQAVRRAGSAALDLCYVACGRFDGFWELKLHPWDTAAAWLIIGEAGGNVTDFSGVPFGIFKGECVASNGTQLHNRILDVIAEVREAQEKDSRTPAE